MDFTSLKNILTPFIWTGLYNHIGKYDRSLYEFILSITFYILKIVDLFNESDYKQKLVIDFWEDK